MAFKLKNLIDDKTSTHIFKNLINVLFQIHRRTYRCKNINYPDVPCIFALWHAHQCGLYSLKDRENISIMISKSRDGDMIAYAVERLDFKTVRGSKTRGGSTATLELIERLKNGESGAITIDGPKGPKYVVKKGIVEIARITGIPIVPMSFYCGKRGWIEFKTWDNFRYPIPFKKILNIYGDPIYVPKDADDDAIEHYRKLVEDKLFELQERTEKDYKKLLKTKGNK